MRESWKRELLNGDVKTSEDFKNELEEKWKLNLFDSTKPPISPVSNPLSQTSTVKETAPKSDTAPKFSVVIPQYLEFMKRNKRRLSSIGESEVRYKDFIEIIGDKPISDYTRNDARDYRNTISKIPKNRRKLRDYRGKSISELLKMDIPDSDILNIET